MKRCARCSQTKPRVAFNRHHRSKDGLQSWCKDCHAAHHKQPGGGTIQRYDISKEELERCISSGMTNEEMAREFGCSPSAISARRKKYGLNHGRHPSKLPETPVQVMELSDVTLPPLSPMVPILEMDTGTICWAARAVRTAELVKRMRNGGQ